MNNGNEEPVRVGLVGLGGHGRTIQNWISRTPTLRVVTVYDTVRSESDAAAARFGCEVAGSYEEVIGMKGVELVAMATPNHLHLPHTIAAFEAGLHVFVEKPIANTVADGIAMVEAAERTGRLLLIGHNMRYNRASRKAQEIIDGGELGEIVSVEMHFSANNTPRIPSDAWRLQPELCPLLPVTQLGIHGIDLLHFLVGQITDVFAFARSVTTRPGVFDAVSAVMRTASGLAITMTSNYCTPVIFEIRFAGTKRNMTFTPHTLEIGPPEGFEAKTDDDVVRMAYWDNQQDGFEAEMKMVAQAVRGTGTLETHGRVGLQATAVDEALRKSIASAQVVPVPDYLTKTNLAQP